MFDDWKTKNNKPLPDAEIKRLKEAAENDKWYRDVKEEAIKADKENDAKIAKGGSGFKMGGGGGGGGSKKAGKTRRKK